MGRPQAALPALEDWLAHCRDRGDRHALGDAEALLGAQLVSAGRLEDGKSHLLSAISLLGEMGDDAALARLHLHLMIANYSLGDAASAMRHLEELMRRRERLHDVSLEAEIEAILGNFPTDGF
jgi:tetratricopeptide (TPR) repeat protein